MKTILTTLSIMTALFAFAAPASADCTTLDATGGFVCVSVDDPRNAYVMAFQPGAGSVSADTYQYSFFGQTYKGENVYIFTDPSGPAGGSFVAVNDFCMANMAGDCVHRDTSVTVVTGATGVTSVGLSQGPDGRAACYSVGALVGCQPLTS